MTSKFDIIFEQAMHLVYESIASDIDALSISDDDKTWLKGLVDHNGKPDQKKQKAAIHWIRKGFISLPDDESLLKKALMLTNGLLNDFTLVSDKDELEYAVAQSETDLKKAEDKKKDIAEAKTFDPSTEPTFSRPTPVGDNVIIYDVENSREGQKAVRKAIDKYISYDSNPWCLARRDELLPAEQQLDEAWSLWQTYSAYPKRIAFKDGTLHAFCAGKREQYVEWWDRQDDPTLEIPGCTAEDDVNFLKKYGRGNLVKMGKYDESFIDDPSLVVRQMLAKYATDVEILKKMVKDKSYIVKRNIIYNPNATAEILRELAKDEDKLVKEALINSHRADPMALAIIISDEGIPAFERAGMFRNCMKEGKLDEAAIRHIIGNSDYFLKKTIAEFPTTPPSIVDELSRDEDWRVRERAALNSAVPNEALKRLLNDEHPKVKQAAKDTVMYYNREI